MTPSSLEWSHCWRDFHLTTDPPSTPSWSTSPSEGVGGGNWGKRGEGEEMRGGEGEEMRGGGGRWGGGEEEGRGGRFRYECDMNSNNIDTLCKCVN